MRWTKGETCATKKLKEMYVFVESLDFFRREVVGYPDRTYHFEAKMMQYVLPQLILKKGRTNPPDCAFV